LTPLVAATLAGCDTILFHSTFRDVSLSFGVLDARNGMWIRCKDWLNDVR
jgi:hypothetical protein